MSEHKGTESPETDDVFNIAEQQDNILTRQSLDIQRRLNILKERLDNTKRGGYEARVAAIDEKIDVHKDVLSEQIVDINSQLQEQIQLNEQIVMLNREVVESANTYLAKVAETNANFDAGTKFFEKRDTSTSKENSEIRRRIEDLEEKLSRIRAQ